MSDFRITDRNIYNGRDYHTLSSEKRAIDLDNLEADDGHVVTGKNEKLKITRKCEMCVFLGVRFKIIGTHLNFEIYISKFDFDTGKLQNPNVTSKWIDNPNTDVSLKNPR